MERLYRGHILNPHSSEKIEQFENGALHVNAEGKIEFCGNYDDFQNKGIQEKDTNGRIIIPGFVDTHIHLPQYDVRGSFSGTGLLPWLKKYIWPEESNFKDVEHAGDVAKRFYDALIQNGTLTAGIFGTIHEEAVKIMFEKAPFRAIIGKVMMDQNSPEYLTETTEDSLRITEKFCEEFARKGDTYFAVTPRFAPTCSMESMRKAAEYAKKYDVYVQSHLNENEDEIKWVKELFPDCESYCDVYYKAGLLGPKTIMAHVIHSTDKELDILKQTKTKIAHCPTSNEALQSGVMPISRILEKNIRFALATDVGAGPHVSMFDVMRSYLEVHGDAVTPESALYYATLAGAEIFGFAEKTGNLVKGKFADFLVIDSRAKVNEPASKIIKRLCNLKDYNQIVQKTVFKGKELYSKQSIS